MWPEMLWRARWARQYMNSCLVPSHLRRQRCSRRHVRCRGIPEAEPARASHALDARGSCRCVQGQEGPAEVAVSVPVKLKSTATREWCLVVTLRVRPRYSAVSCRLLRTPGAKSVATAGECDSAVAAVSQPGILLPTSAVNSQFVDRAETLTFPVALHGEAPADGDPTMTVCRAPLPLTRDLQQHLSTLGRWPVPRGTVTMYPWTHSSAWKP